MRWARAHFPLASQKTHPSHLAQIGPDSVVRILERFQSRPHLPAPVELLRLCPHCFINVRVAAIFLEALVKAASRTLPGAGRAPCVFSFCRLSC